LQGLLDVTELISVYYFSLKAVKTESLWKFVLEVEVEVLIEVDTLG
jgi:hypothetical protein